MLTVLVHSLIRKLPSSLSHVEESMAGHVGINGVYGKLRKRSTKGA
jgi:hypothetical protein